MYALKDGDTQAMSCQPKNLNHLSESIYTTKNKGIRYSKPLSAISESPGSNICTVFKMPDLHVSCLSDIDPGNNFVIAPLGDTPM